MKINEQIRNHRKDVGLTQEQVAAHLGVSAPAVNKWEKGSTYPDVALLPALARLLKIDMNELFLFREELTEFEVGQFVNEITRIAMEESIDAAFEMATAKIQEYPHCDTLLYMTATTLDGALVLSDISDENKQKYGAKVFDWLERIIDSADEKIRYSAAFLLATKYLQMQEYEKASSFLRRLPDVPIDKNLLQAKILLHQKDENAATVFLEGNLLQAIVKVQSYLYQLLEIEEQSGKHREADEIAEISDKLCSLFGLWRYGIVVPHLLIALSRKDTTQSIRLIEAALAESQKPWDMSASALYYRYPQKSFDRIGKSFAKSFISEIRSKEEYAFLRGNEKLEEILANYETVLKN